MTTPRTDNASIGTSEEDALRARSFAVRHPIHLDAQYQVEGLPLWLRCHVVDISTHGAGLILVDEVTDPMRAVVVNLRSPAGAERIVLHGEVRHSSLADGRRRIGVAFRAMGRLDELALCELIARHAELGVPMWQPELPDLH